MLEHLEVNPARLATAAENIAAAGRGIDELLDALRAEATTLSSRWSGDAQQAFLSAQLRFDEIAVTRLELLRLMCDALDTLAGAYSEADLAGGRALGVAS